MDEKNKNEQQANESLAEVLPTPITASDATSPANILLSTAIFTAAGAGAFFLLAGTMMPCVGATRSAKLKWEERQLQIEQAERDANVSDCEQP